MHNIEADKLKDHVDIVGIIGAVTPLKAKGRSFKGLCPFHKEKTPSFDVSRDKQQYYCFGCGAKGDVITFVEDHFHLSFHDALEYLALFTSSYRSQEDASPEALDVMIRQNMKGNMMTYEQAIKQAGKMNQEKARAASGPLGLPPNFYPLGHELITSVNQYAFGRGFNFKKMRRMGFGGCVGGKYSGRLVLPVYHGEKLMFWQARDALDRDTAKYLSAPGYSPSLCLFNLDKAVTFDRVIIVEGAFGALRTGDDTVGTMGNKISDEQIQLLLDRGVKHVVLAYDPNAWFAPQPGDTEYTPEPEKTKKCGILGGKAKKETKKLRKMIAPVETAGVKLVNAFEQVELIQLYGGDPDDIGTKGMRRYIDNHVLPVRNEEAVRHYVNEADIPF